MHISMQQLEEISSVLTLYELRMLEGIHNISGLDKVQDYPAFSLLQTQIPNNRQLNFFSHMPDK